MKNMKKLLSPVSFTDLMPEKPCVLIFCEVYRMKDHRLSGGVINFSIQPWISLKCQEFELWIITILR